MIGLGAYFKILTAPSWTWCMPLAGLVTLAMPWVFFYDAWATGNRALPAVFGVDTWSESGFGLKTWA